MAGIFAWRFYVVVTIDVEIVFEDPIAEHATIDSRPGAGRPGIMGFLVRLERAELLKCSFLGGRLEGRILILSADDPVRHVAIFPCASLRARI